MGRVYGIAGYGLAICERVALNGTVTPVDDLKGIPQQVFEGTLEGLNEVALEKFIRRMCLKKENLETFLSKRPQRAVEELQEELRRIGEQVKSCAVPSFAWERAVIGKNDFDFYGGQPKKCMDRDGSGRV